jgi:hypothetical protein
MATRVYRPCAARERSDLSLGSPARRAFCMIGAMAEARIVHEIECSVDTFWERIFLDDAFNERLHKSHLKFLEWKIVDREETSTGFRRVVEVAPSVGDMPAALKKVLGDNIRYRERGEYFKAERRYRVDVVPRSLGGKLSVRGEVTCEPAGENRCRRIFSARVEARFFGVGGMLEKRIVSDLYRSYERAAAYTNTYLRESGLSG